MYSFGNHRNCNLLYMIILKVQVDVKVFNFFFLGMILKIPTPSQSRTIAFLETNNKTFDKRYGIIVGTLGLTISPRARPPTFNPFKVQPGGLCTFYLKKKKSSAVLL